MNLKWNKGKLYALYWVGYLLLFTLIEGSTDRDFVNVFRNELISLAPKMLFVWLVLEKLFFDLPAGKKFVSMLGLYIVLILSCAFLMRLIDNYIILRYFLTYWVKEPLLSAAPFLYNVIKLQFLLTVPFCVKLYRHLNIEKSRLREMQPMHIESEKTFLLIKCDRRIVKVFFDDIYYFESQGNYIEVFTINGNYKTYLSMAELEEKLSSPEFLRVHRSFVVAVNKIGSHNLSRLVINNKTIPIGRSYISSVRKHLTAS